MCRTTRAVEAWRTRAHRRATVHAWCLHVCGHLQRRVSRYPAARGPTAVGVFRRAESVRAVSKKKGDGAAKYLDKCLDAIHTSVHMPIHTSVDSRSFFSVLFLKEAALRRHIEWALGGLLVAGMCGHACRHVWACMSTCARMHVDKFWHACIYACPTCLDACQFLR